MQGHTPTLDATPFGRTSNENEKEATLKRYLVFRFHEYELTRVKVSENWFNTACAWSEFVYWVSPRLMGMRASDQILVSRSCGVSAEADRIDRAWEGGSCQLEAACRASCQLVVASFRASCRASCQASEHPSSGVEASFLLAASFRASFRALAVLPLVVVRTAAALLVLLEVGKRTKEWKQERYQGERDIVVSTTKQAALDAQRRARAKPGVAGVVPGAAATGGTAGFTDGVETD